MGGCFDRFDSPKGMLVLHVSLDDAVHRICSPFPANLKLELSGEKILRHDNKRKAQKPSKNSPDFRRAKVFFNPGSDPKNRKYVIPGKIVAMVHP